METRLICFLTNAGPANDWVNSQHWVEWFVFAIINGEFESPSKEMLQQIRLVASRAHVMTYLMIQMFLEQCIDGSIALPPVGQWDDFIWEVQA